MVECGASANRTRNPLISSAEVVSSSTKDALRRLGEQLDPGDLA
jgi:hypothetical protein